MTDSFGLTTSVSSVITPAVATIFVVTATADALTSNNHQCCFLINLKREIGMIGEIDNITGNLLKRRTKPKKYCTNAVRINNVKINTIFLIYR